ncbi:EamA family transporter RarD [Oceanospirillum linum]|uniref:EamA family transporter RarD n=1 Tax=Oceanospirillum linum TaxID=966 RepID=UPI00089F20F0|nr:EamA family transporter RarD [Oceanospirillum linum]SEG01673.1 chloramphenicol-sensitive protein RarD [Oleiphilus messinensis]SMP21793.1 chloramphenicol-sensitive protein RarD [Oceanospirillum linum]
MAEDKNLRQGIIFALAAYTIWGIAPVYFKSVTHVPAFEVLVHRIIWSVVFLSLFIGFTGRLGKVVAVFRQPRLLGGLMVTALIISLNWLVFIWAVAEGRILETSLGYFVNPLISVFLGMVFLSERLRPMQWLALSFAGLGVLYQLIEFGSLPWVGLVLAFSFGFYGLLRKQLVVEAVPGLFIETLIVLPVGLIALGWMQSDGSLVFGHQSLQTDLLLVVAGLVTTFPLLFFAGAARRLTLSMIGFFQYLAPSITFVLAVFVYEEPLDSSKLVTFALIWFGLLLFTGEGRLVRYRQRRQIIGVDPVEK